MAKNNNLLIFGGLAVAGYLYFEHKKKMGVPLAVAPAVVPKPIALPAKTVTPTVKAPPSMAAPPNLPNKLSHIQVNPTVALTPVTPLPAGYQGVYNANIPNSNTTVKLMLTPSDPRCTLKVNNVIVKANAWSPAIPVKVGKTTVHITSTGVNGTTTSYAINFNRASGALKGIIGWDI